MKWLYWIKWVLSLCLSILKNGIQLYSLLDALTRLNPNKTAFIIDEEQISYKLLKQRADFLIQYWSTPIIKNQLPQRLGLFIHQDLDSLAALFTLSRLGKDIIILNPNLVQDKLEALITQQELFLIGSKQILAQFNTGNGLPYPLFTNDFEGLSIKIKPRYLNKISVCSSGSTGIPKVASRKSNPLQSFPLLNLMLRKLEFFKITKIFVMTPICHAAGLTASLMAFSFSKIVILQKRFKADTAIDLIEQHQIDGLNLVPTILYRLINHDAPLNPVKYIITGSAPLNAQLVKKVINNYPYISLFNLYGSSETGINIYASPNDLLEHPNSIGKPIKGVGIKITDTNGNIIKENETGLLWTKCAWSVQPNQWTNCGDLASYDANGYFYLKGRIDSMLICGGVNVYPIDLESIIYQHPSIQYVQAYAIPDTELGECLAVNIILNRPTDILNLKQWIEQRAPRYLRPKQIKIIEQIEVDSIGKPIIDPI